MKGLKSVGKTKNSGPYAQLSVKMHRQSESLPQIEITTLTASPKLHKTKLKVDKASTKFDKPPAPSNGNYGVSTKEIYIGEVKLRNGHARLNTKVNSEYRKSFNNGKYLGSVFA